MFERGVRALCRLATRRPWLMLLATALVCVPAGWQASTIHLDTDLKRLLPRDSRAVRWSRALETAVGDGGYFSVILEGDDRAALDRAVEEIAAAAEAWPDVQSVEYRNPVDFVRRYKYLLVPSERLQQLVARVNRLETKVNPLLEDLDAEESPEAGNGGAHAEDDAEVERQLDRVVDLTEAHSADGRLRGLIVRPRRAVTNLGAIRDLYGRLDGVVQKIAARERLWGGISGSLRSKVDVYLQISDDLNRSGTVATIGIIVVLILPFRSVRVLPVVFAPLLAGLCWSYALVPWLVGDLNTVTSFLLMVLLGMGEEFSIHLVRRYEDELRRGVDAGNALQETFLSTGRSILTSGFATTLGMAVLLFSRFRGFSEFGLIAGTAIFSIFVAMFTVLPPALVVGTRLRLVRGHSEGERGIRWIPGLALTGAVVVLVVLAAGVAVHGLSFDYDFQNLQPDLPAAAAVKEKHRQVYPDFSAPAAVYVAGDLPSLDAALCLVEDAKAHHPDVIGTVSSVRDFMPGPEEWRKRQALQTDLQERLSAPWTRRIKDQRQQRWISDIREFAPPQAPPSLEDLPPVLAGALTASACTTVMGYAGMVLAHHAGLRSIGSLAVLGLFACWFTGVVLMPGVLALLARRGRAAALACIPRVGDVR